MWWWTLGGAARGEETLSLRLSLSPANKILICFAFAMPIRY